MASAEQIEIAGTLSGRYSLAPLSSLSALELGQLFMTIFRSGTLVYGHVFRDAPELYSPYITNHKQLLSFKQLGLPRADAQGLSRAQDLLHREFRNLSFRLTECVLTELEKRLGPEERAVDIVPEQTEGSDRWTVRNSVPGREALARLEAATPITAFLLLPNRQRLELQLDNSRRVGHGVSVLQACLALRDQTIAGIGQPSSVLRWLRDTVGLQDTVYATALQIQNVFIEAIQKQYPTLSPYDVDLEIPVAAREELATIFIEEVHKMQWAYTTSYIYSPLSDSPNRVSLGEVIDTYCQPKNVYTINSCHEAATVVFALGNSLPVKELIPQIGEELVSLARKLQNLEVEGRVELLQQTVHKIQSAAEVLGASGKSKAGATLAVRLLSDFLQNG